MQTRSLLPDFSPVGGRRPPDPLVRLLREVDPRAELVYCGAGKWLLGTVEHNSLRARRCELVIKNIRKLQTKVGNGSIVIPRHVKKALSFRLWRWELNRQGHRAIARYDIQGEPGSWIHEDFRERDYRYRTDLEGEIRRQEEEADAELEVQKKLEQFSEFLELEHKSIHRHAFKRPIIMDGGKARHRRRVG